MSDGSDTTSKKNPVAVFIGLALVGGLGLLGVTREQWLPQLTGEQAATLTSEQPSTTTAEQPATRAAAAPAIATRRAVAEHERRNWRRITIPTRYALTLHGLETIRVKGGFMMNRLERCRAPNRRNPSDKTLKTHD